MRNRNWIILVGTLILLAGLGGAGVLVFQAGAAQGASAGVEHTEAIRPMILGAPLLKIGLSIVIVFFLLKLASHVIFFPLLGMGMHARRWRATAHGPWMSPGPWGKDQNIPAFFNTWHAQSHREGMQSPPSEDRNES